MPSARRGRANMRRRLATTAHADPRDGDWQLRPLDPPAPPIALNAVVASDPDTPLDVLWHIARHAPQLRKWVVVNRAADANLLEFISQQGGPGVRETLELLLDALERRA
ncbi:hypothetical protein [Bifidobacterium pseudolongum]|uniref:variant leucine-rich repeat-containing protein n=1 Tax=Bifidobacterium pseudolongum TaxID=1694 RepID=UPI0005054D53|nr:hypothetical protein [Bifidobacterium pseudolongum]KFI78945.1 hypothetical protein BPSP_1316 [Bifidobacterium pseudolongum subsp. pseudolongum]PKU99827.1 hypothetical protein CQR52_1269 [Bifidobacterium pseudolongum subsp. pseudolongum]PKV06939.1 hypothetical protein CQR49_1524 [Bifidobacterium pseudolongum subsp. pseudolongum]RYQ47384.1 hypothetical protein PG1629B_1491 [Bifidobacterium pseudolongum subsp. pseudolongum]RYQ50314.1 hypothetical protein PG1612B_1535 [Bifidobacterium pseudolon